MLGGKSLPEASPTPPKIEGRPKLGAFTRMLRERGGRHIACDIGNPDEEKAWKLSGWSKPIGKGLARHRKVGDSPATITFSGMFHKQFDYSHCVFRLAEPRSLEGVALSISGRAISIPKELLEQGKQSLWQIPLPPGLATSISKFELTITAPNWRVTDFAVVGDPIRDLHLAMLDLSH